MIRTAIAACPICATGPAESESASWLLGAMMAAPFAVALIAGLVLLRMWRGGRG